MVTRLFAVGVLSLALLAGVALGAQDRKAQHEIFETSDRCLACHNGLRTPSGQDVSIGADWRGSMMANSSRDPYWQAGVRREVLDHPSASTAIQDECATCHMPMARTEERMSGGEGAVFANLPVSSGVGRQKRLAHDGVSCSLCHQITEKGLGTRESFTGGYAVSAPGDAAGPRRVFGPFQIERGLTTVMRSATGFVPTEAAHVKQSELCATCHTLVTRALDSSGAVVGELPEQMPYLEWTHSSFVRDERSCQSCHMPTVKEETPIASVLGAPRKGLAQHVFVGGNVFMQSMLARYRTELGVTASDAELDAAMKRTRMNLQTATAELSLDASMSGDRLVVDVTARNLTGHKLPTGYPSRRAWLHLTVRDRAGRTVFESGAIGKDGAIAGNDQDVAGGGAEPHYAQITKPDEVQIYESVMADRDGRPTTGLLSAVRFLKDNRLLPAGFDKASADPWIAVVGAAASDPDFAGAEDRTRYNIDVSAAGAPFQIEAELRFQSIGYRWAQNLKAYRSDETARFVNFYDAMADSSSEVLAAAQATAK